MTGRVPKVCIKLRSETLRTYNFTAFPPFLLPFVPLFPSLEWSLTYVVAFKLHIAPCIRTPTSYHHSLPPEKPLRIQIESQLVSIQKLLPEILWHTNPLCLEFSQPVDPELARLAYQALYGRDVCPEIARDMVVRDEYLGWVTEVMP
jgi:hypothetical protein